MKFVPKKYSQLLIMLLQHALVVWNFYVLSLVMIGTLPDLETSQYTSGVKTTYGGHHFPLRDALVITENYCIIVLKKIADNIGKTKFQLLQ